jgi:hypothetical protein
MARPSQNICGYFRWLGYKSANHQTPIPSFIFMFLNLPSLAYSLLAQADATDLSTGPDMPQAQISPVGIVIALVFFVLIIASLWRIFTKAGQPGWASIIPIYNAYILLKIAGKPGWWLILLIIPFVNLIIVILMSLGLAQNFGKGAGFGIGLAFLNFIFLPILAFGDARYQGPAPTPALAV